MATARFCCFELRTTAVAAAREFYEAVIGGEGDGIIELSTAALARGARAHWLGHVDVAGRALEELAGQWVDRGAVRLGAPSGSEAAILRDPGGALFALTPSAMTSHAGVVWHQLHTPDAERAAQSYAELFGWAIDAEEDLGALGRYRPLSWEVGGPRVGAIGDVATRPGVHPHWTFFFGVGSLDAALKEVKERGGRILGPSALPSGRRFAVCDDPQDAVFGLMEPE
jgi:predicted enzyme related to lactoylglutathione lyase